MKRSILLSGLALALMALPSASAGQLVQDVLTSKCTNCGKKAVDLGQWDNCALAGVAQGGPNSSCAVGHIPDGWVLSLVDPSGDSANPQPQSCSATCFSVDRPAGHMSGTDVSHKVWADMAQPGTSVSTPSTPAPTTNSGRLYAAYKTSEGVWTPEYTGGTSYRGRYPTDSGRIIGNLNGTQFDGYWVEGSSQYKCSSPRDGSYYWGRVKFNFTADLSSFTGKWGYCEREPTAGWNGSRQ